MRRAATGIGEGSVPACSRGVTTGLCMALRGSGQGPARGGRADFIRCL